MQEVLFCETEYGSPDYQKVLVLRNIILRIPLGLSLWEEDLRDEREQNIFFLKEEEAIRACLLMKKVSKEEVKLRQMAVSKQWQGRGMGKLLVKKAEGWAEEKGFRKISLHARENALGFYQKMNYQKMGESFLEVGIPHFKMEKILR